MNDRSDPKQGSASKRRPFWSNPVRLLALVALLFAGTAHVIRQDLVLTRVNVNRPADVTPSPPRLSPLTAIILQRVRRSDWRFSTPSLDAGAASKPLEFVRSELRVTLPNAADHTKLWDFLDESYVQGPDILPTKALSTFSRSMFITDAINLAGLCDYLETRTYPALWTYVSRRDFAGARRIVVEANTWIDAMKSDPTLAGNSPRLQAYINVFRRLDAFLLDPGFLYRHPSETDKIFAYLTSTKSAPLEVLSKLKHSQDAGLRAWGYYLSGSAQLTHLQYREAQISFGKVKADSENPELIQLATLGAVRAIFWSSIDGQVDREEALKQISEASRGLRGPRFLHDVNFYKTQLAARRSES